MSGQVCGLSSEFIHGRIYLWAKRVHLAEIRRVGLPQITERSGGRRMLDQFKHRRQGLGEGVEELQILP
jgi:hypothetical protein